MATLPLVGQEFAGYQVRAVIGRGGMSVVFQAENPRLGNVVALKVLAPELATDDAFRTRFLQESRTAAALNHPNVIPIFDVGPCEDLLYIAMRYVSGTDLRALLKKERQIQPQKALAIIGQVAWALDAAHRKGLVHRDVKPGNILIEGGTDDHPLHVYLADFGITKHALSRSGLTSTGEFLGTIDYVAPEQIQGTPVDGRTDQYSLGCVLYECLTGHVPFEKELDAAVIWAHVEELPPMPSALNPVLPTAVDEVLARVLAKKAADRYPSCRAFVEAVGEALGRSAAEPQTVPRYQEETASAARPQAGEPGLDVISRSADGISTGAAGTPGGQGPAEEPPPRAPRSRRLRVLVALAGLAVIIGGGIGAWAALRGGAGSPAHHSGSPTPSSSHRASPLEEALVKANRSQGSTARGLLSTCHQDSASQATCTNPAPSFGITKAWFRVYRSPSALYDAYVATVKPLADQHEFRQNFLDCSDRNTEGEISWRHMSPWHVKTYSLAQSRSGTLTDDQAAGRVFCNFVNGQEYFVWTQNDGHLLAWVSGAPHTSVWQWWREVHHSIPLSGSGMQGMNS